MKNNKKNIDIRILKYEEYIKKHPQKAYGYYCLGRLYLMKEKYKVAEEYFQKSLAIDGNYTLSKVALIETYVFRKKFLKAVYMFGKNRQEIIDKFIYRVKMVRGISSFYSKSDLFKNKQKGLFNALFMKYTMHVAKELAKKESHNIVLKLILCMYYINSSEKSLYIIQLFKTCVYWDGLDDTLRWTLVERLSELGEKLYYDINIARKFSTIPDSKCANEYVDLIFSSSLVKGDRGKLAGIYDTANKYKKSVSPSILWRYVYWSKENSFYDPTVYDCCKKLMKLGWMDKVIAETVLRFEEKNAVKLEDEAKKALKLFGYTAS